MKRALVMCVFVCGCGGAASISPASSASPPSAAAKPATQGDADLYAKRLAEARALRDEVARAEAPRTNQAAPPKPEAFAHLRDTVAPWYREQRGKAERAQGLFEAAVVAAPDDASRAVALYEAGDVMLLVAEGATRSFETSIPREWMREPQLAAMFLSATAQAIDPLVSSARNDGERCARAVPKDARCETVLHRVGLLEARRAAQIATAAQPTPTPPIATDSTGRCKCERGDPMCSCAR